jgi:hypothetical protein
MTRKDISRIEVGTNVYIWGNREKAQKVRWRGLGTLGTGSQFYIRFETGMFFALYEPELIDFAPSDAITETRDMSTHKLTVRNGFSGTEFIEVDVPNSNNFNERNYFMYTNGIVRDENYMYVTYNADLIKIYKEEV